MSRRREARSIIAIALGLGALLAAGCVFSPKSEPPPPPEPIRSPSALIRALERSYRERNYPLFQSLLSAEQGAPYLFLLDTSGSNPPEVSQWTLTEELRIHQRMFEPQNIPPGDTPLDPANWLLSVAITLTLQVDWRERTDLYRSDVNPEGLDSAIWKAEEAVYGTDVFFEMQGETDYLVDGRASFVVITNLTKSDDQAGKFLIYRWEDLGINNKPTAGPSV